MHDPAWRSQSQPTVLSGQSCLGRRLSRELRGCGRAGGIQPGHGQLQLGAGLGVLPRHEASRGATEHPLLQRCEHTPLTPSPHRDVILFRTLHLQACQGPLPPHYILYIVSHEPAALVCAELLTPFCSSQLLAACERDGEADRALEAFARMEREAPGDMVVLGPDMAPSGLHGCHTIHEAGMRCDLRALHPETS